MGDALFVLLFAITTTHPHGQAQSDGTLPHLLDVFYDTNAVAGEYRSVSHCKVIFLGARWIRFYERVPGSKKMNLS